MDIGQTTITDNQIDVFTLAHLQRFRTALGAENPIPARLQLDFASQTLHSITIDE
jgi:hypothetical protein